MATEISKEDWTEKGKTREKDQMRFIYSLICSLDGKLLDWQKIADANSITTNAAQKRFSRLKQKAVGEFGMGNRVQDKEGEDEGNTEMQKGTKKRKVGAGNDDSEWEGKDDSTEQRNTSASGKGNAKRRGTNRKLNGENIENERSGKRGGGRGKKSVRVGVEEQAKESLSVLEIRSTETKEGEQGNVTEKN